MKNRKMKFSKPLGAIQFIGALFLILTSQAAFAQGEDPIKLIDKEQPKKAIGLLRDAVKTTPTAQSWYNLGYGLTRTNEVKEAETSFDQGIALDEKFPLNYVGKGRLKLKEGNLNDAKLLFDKAVGLGKKNADVYSAIGEAYLQDPKFNASSIETLEKAVSINGQHAASHILLGDAYLKQNNANGGKAVSNYEKAATLSPKEGMPHYKVGIVYLRSTNYDVALTSFLKAVEVDPNFAPAWSELGELYYATKKGPEAVKAQEKYISLIENKDDVIAKTRLAFYQFMAKEYTKSVATFDDVAKLGPLNETSKRYLAFALSEAGDSIRAPKAFEDYFSTAKPETIEARDYNTYGQLLQNLKQDSLALIAYDKSLLIDPKQVAILQAKAEALFKTKKYTEAATAYKALMAARPKPLSADYFTLGRAYYNGKVYQSADTAFQKLIELQPKMTVGYLWAGRANASIDSTSEKGLGKPYYEKLIEMALPTPDKYKKELIESYRYFGYFYYLQKDYTKSLTFWDKVLALEPKDEQALDAVKSIKAIKNPPPAKKP